MSEPPVENSAAPSSTFAAGRKNRGNIRRRPRDDDEEDSEAGPVGAPQAAKKVKVGKDASMVFSTKRQGEKMETFKFSSSRALQQQTDQGATNTLETETQFDRDARLVLINIEVPNLYKTICILSSWTPIEKDILAWECFFGRSFLEVQIQIMFL